jgi:glutathione S-transferase
MIRLYWCANTRARRILWMLEELGQPFERITVDIRSAEAKADPAFRAVSPMGKVPALEDGTTRLWDSGAICAYLADQYPAAGLAPPVGHPDRGRYLQWLLYTNAVIEPAMAEKFAGLDSRPQQYGWGSWEHMLATFRAGLQPGPWALGATFSAADVLLGMSAHFLRDFKLLTDDPVILPYADRCAARPAFQRAAAADIVAA